MFNFFKKRRDRKAEALRKARIEDMRDAPTPQMFDEALAKALSYNVAGFDTIWQLGRSEPRRYCAFDPNYIAINEAVDELTGNDISHTADAALIAQFIDDQNITLDEFCDDFDHNIALARLTQ